MNTPTIEEVKNVADACANNPVSLGVHSGKALTYEQLQAFAQHWMKVQRESDAKCASFMFTDKSLGETFALIIRNNTGD